MIGDVIIIIAFAVFTPVFWGVLIATVFAYFFSRKIWIAAIVSLPISVFLYMIAYANHTGLLDMSLGFQILMAISATCMSIFLIWIIRTISRAIGRRNHD